MHILKLKNFLIISILLGISSSYCVDAENGDFFVPQASSWSRRSMSGSEENCEEAQYQRLLRTFLESKQSKKQASQRWRQNISAGFQAFYEQEAAEVATDAAQCLPRVDLHDGPTSDEKNSGLITPASFIRHPDMLPLGSVSDTDESTGILSPIALTHTHASSAEDAEVSALASLHAVSLRISPSLSDNDGSSSLQPSSPGSSTHSQCDYVSDSDDEEPKQRGFFGAIVDTLFGW
jgi:hypothetical protein